MMMFQPTSGRQGFGYVKSSPNTNGSLGDRLMAWCEFPFVDAPEQKNIPPVKVDTKDESNAPQQETMQKTGDNSAGIGN